MRKSLLVLASLALSIFAATSASAHYWRLAGPPAFDPSVNGIPAYAIGETRPSTDGAGGQVTLVQKTATSAEVLSISSRWGAHRIRYGWDAPPEILRPGQSFTTRISWEIAERWSQFSPQMLALSHLDWSPDFYLRSLKYGYGQPDDLTSFSGYDSNTWTVTTNDSGQLHFYTHIACGGAWVRVTWTYNRVDGTAPAATTEHGNTATAGDATAGHDRRNHATPQGVPSGTPSTWRVPAGNTGSEPLGAPAEPVVYRNGADGAVTAGVMQPTRFQLNLPMLLTQIMTYHFGSHGRPGTIALQNDDGTVYGPWQAAGAGSASQPNVYWWARPKVVIKPGAYTVIDSDPASWSQEAATQGAGIVQLWGRQQ